MLGRMSKRSHVCTFFMGALATWLQESQMESHLPAVCACRQTGEELSSGKLDRENRRALPIPSASVDEIPF